MVEMFDLQKKEARSSVVTVNVVKLFPQQKSE